jgi:hypothetical protein
MPKARLVVNREVTLGSALVEKGPLRWSRHARLAAVVDDVAPHERVGLRRPQAFGARDARRLPTPAHHDQ